MKPAHTNSRPALNWINPFKTARPICPFRMYKNSSNPKVENVVNPPKKPVNISSLISGGKICRASAMPPNSPIIKTPQDIDGDSAQGERFILYGIDIPFIYQVAAHGSHGTA